MLALALVLLKSCRVGTNNWLTSNTLKVIKWEQIIGQRAKKAILKSNVSSNKNEIRFLKDKIVELQHKIDELKKD